MRNFIWPFVNFLEALLWLKILGRSKFNFSHIHCILRYTKHFAHSVSAIKDNKSYYLCSSNHPCDKCLLFIFLSPLTVLSFFFSSFPLPPFPSDLFTDLLTKLTIQRFSVLSSGILPCFYFMLSFVRFSDPP